MIVLSSISVVSVLLALVPVVAVSPILLYVGMLIGAQAFQDHAGLARAPRSCSRSRRILQLRARP